MFCWQGWGGGWRKGRKERGGRRQRKARDSTTSLLFLASHQQANWLLNRERLTILMNSVNIFPENLPWIGYCAEDGGINEEYIF